VFETMCKPESTQFFLRTLTEADAEAASQLAQESFAEFVAADWTPEACERFHAHSTPDVLRQSLQSSSFTAGAFVGASMVGFILMPQPSFVRMLFVKRGAMRQGIGGQLWESARTHTALSFPKVATVELNASPYAIAFYRRIGFVAISAEYLREGSRATRMACWLPARALGAVL